MKSFRSTKILLASVLFLLTICLSAQASSENSHPFVVSGVIINNDNTRLIERFSAHISRLAGIPLHVVYVNTYAGLSKILREDPMALGWTCGAPFVQDHLADKQQLIAIPLFNKKPTYSSVILARREGTETKLADFKNGVLAYSDERSNSGYLSPKYTLYNQGIEMEKHFRLLINAGNHEGSIDALLNGLADVAAIDEYVWVAYLRKHPNAKRQLREIERMGPFPFTPIVAGSKISTEVINKISKVLLDMSHNIDGKKLLNDFYLDGFVKKEISFYNPIVKMLAEVDIVTGK